MTSKLKKALDLSRNYQTRSQDESQYLYSYINLLVRDSKGEDDRLAKDALSELVTLFKPKILKCFDRYYRYVVEYVDADDFLQEAHALFIACVINYDPEQSSFLYYVKEVYPRQVWSWVEKTFKTHRVLTELGEVELPHPQYDTDDKVFSRLMENTYTTEYVDFIHAVADRGSKTDTLKAVCYDYFLGTKTCRQLSEELSISYHAVYDYISKIKKELNYHLRHSKTFDFFFDSEGYVKNKERGR